MANVLSIQFKPKLGDKDHNLAIIKKHLEENKHRNIDLVLLPEFFSTGIHHESFLNFSEDENGGKTIEQIKTLACAYKTNIIAGTVIERENKKLYNTSFVIDRCGKTITKYRKIHLYNYLGGTEDDRITSGKELVVAKLDFATVGLGICFDIRYPQFIRKLAQMGAEIVVLPTAWCVSRENVNIDYEQDIWQSLNKIRAFDNYIYYVSCNQCGIVNKQLQNIGNSMIVAPDGKILKLAKNEECAIQANIDLDIVKYYRKIYPIVDIE